MNAIISNLIPESAKNFIRNFRDQRDLKKLERANVYVENLRKLDSNDEFKLIFNSEKYKGLWDSVSKELQELNLPDDTGGVNTGDQRAIAYLIWHFKPIKILEIGTHIGCSTVHLSVAQRELKLVNEVSGIVTVDIRDVNSAEKPWVAYKAPMSPLDLVTKVNYSDKVTFRCQPSVEYLAQCQDKYDLIFLDGGHSAELVYRELPLACRLLNENGIILLHDYFPNNKPIWDNNSIIPGPYLATERLINEGCNIEIKPLGALPWPTKQNSHFTSLALCTRGKY
jgi:predicted O-methyltransferase YrrM